MEHTINACGHANSTVHENMQSLIEQSGSVRKSIFRVTRRKAFATSKRAV